MKYFNKISEEKKEKVRGIRLYALTFLACLFMFFVLTWDKVEAQSKKPLIDGSNFIAVDVKTEAILFRKEDDKILRAHNMNELIALGALYHSGALKDREKEIGKLLRNYDEEKISKFLIDVFGSEETVVAKANEAIKKLSFKDTIIISLKGDKEEDSTSLRESGSIVSKLLASDKISKEISLKNLDKSDIKCSSLVEGNKEQIYSICLGEKGKSRFLSINIGGASRKGNLNDSQKILKYSLNKYRTYQVLRKAEKIDSVKVKGGRESYCDVIASEDLFVTLPRGADDSIVKENIKIKKELVAPVKKGVKVGSYEALEVGEVTAKTTLITGEEIVVGGPWSKIGISDYMMAIGSALLVLFLIATIIFKVRKKNRLKKIAMERAEKRRKQELLMQREREEKRRRNWPY